MHFATLCPRVFVLVSCLAELCPLSLALCVSFPKSPWNDKSPFLPILIACTAPSSVKGGSGGEHTQRWHRAKDFSFFCCSSLSELSVSGAEVFGHPFCGTAADPSQQPVSSRTGGCRRWINQQSRGSVSSDLGGWGMSPSGCDPVKVGWGEGGDRLKSQPATFPFQPVKPELSSIELTSPGWKQGEGRLPPRG